MARNVVVETTIILIQCRRAATTHALLELIYTGVIVKFGVTANDNSEAFSSIPNLTRLYRYDEIPNAVGIHDGVGWNVAVLMKFKQFLEQE